jgi:hypothetical protein
VHLPDLPVARPLVGGAMTGPDPRLMRAHLGVIARHGRGGWFALGARAEHFKPKYHPVPCPVAELDHAVEWASEICKEADVYACPALSVHKTLRKTEKAGLLWADLDGREDSRRLAQLCELGHVLVWNSGTPGHRHVTAPVDEVLEFEALSLWLKRFREWLGSDPAASNPVGMLRLAGTLNHKQRPPTDVASDWDGHAPVDLVSLARLDIVIGGPRRRVRTPLVDKGLCSSADLPIPDHVAELAHEHVEIGERSQHFFHLVAACFEAGLSLEQTVPVARQHKPSTGKYGRRLAAEVERCWDKLCDDVRARAKRRAALGGDR